MDTRLELLETMMVKTERLMAEVPPASGQRPTPCGDYTVDQLVDHVVTWVQVFDRAVNDRPLDFDPAEHTPGPDRLGVFGDARSSILEGLRSRGFERQMTMTGSPLPGEFVLNMLLMEYIGHGWDLAVAGDAELPFTDEEAEVALTAARAIIEPRYRGTGMFEAEVVVADDASAIDRFIGFLGRDPNWAPAAG